MNNLIYKRLAASLLLVSLVVGVAYAQDTGWKPQSSFQYKSAIIKSFLGVDFLRATDKFGKNGQWWYCVIGRCYELPDGVGL